jgi:hypothetical protein
MGRRSSGSPHRPRPTRVVVGLAITTVSGIARVAFGQTPLPPPTSRPLNIELAVPPGVELRIRPETMKGEDIPDFVTCPPSCALAVYSGRYQLDARPPPDSGLRPVAKTVDISSDAHIAVLPGSRSDHGWGLGLTIGGGIAFGLGLVFFALARSDSARPDTATNVATLSMMGVGAPITLGGIYLLVRSRGRVTVEETWLRSMVPLPPASESRVDIGWRF